MAVLGIFSAKGGVGSSLLATNLGCSLSLSGEVALMDIHPGGGVDDLLLNLQPRHSWKELLPVAGEIQIRHWELACERHPSGMEFYAAPTSWTLDEKQNQLIKIIQTLNERVNWTLLDLPVGLNAINTTLLPLVSRAILITTADPIALRATKRLYDQLPVEVQSRTGLVLNQYTRRHPTKPRVLAEALGIELLATLPIDARAVGYQVNFGQVCVADVRSGYGRAVSAFADRLRQTESHNSKPLRTG